MLLPFEPEDGAVDAHFDKGVLRLTIKKPAKVEREDTTGKRARLVEALLKMRKEKG